MRSIARTSGLSYDVTVASVSDLSNRLAASTLDVVLVGPHLAGDFESITAESAVAGAATALLPPDAFGPTGAASALDLVAGIISMRDAHLAAEPIAAEPIEGSTRA
jgi:cellobiose PTS system EIIB component